jgi:hypothetical protein
MSNHQFKTNEMTDEVSDLVTTITTPENELSHFLEQMVQIDGHTYNKIVSDPKLKAEYFQSPLEVKLAHYDNAFIEEIRRVYDGFVVHAKNLHALAVSIYKLSELTGTSYEGISLILSKSLNHKFNRSYICKLYMAGKALSINSKLSVVKDIEKLALIAKLPESQVSDLKTTSGNILRVADQDVNKVSRSKFNEAVKEAHPDLFPQRAKGKPLQKAYSLSEIQMQLEKFLPSVESKPEIHSAILGCIELIKQKEN